MKILLTNDDGIHAPGLAALRNAVDGAAQPIVVAPKGAASGSSHSTTTDRPLRVERLGEGRHAVHGTPADCVRVALHRFGAGIEWVLAGINNGGNLGVDVYHSGTVAAVREGVLHGVPGIAISHYHNRPLADEDWARAAEWVKPLLADLMQRPWTPGTFWNINLPMPDSREEMPEVVSCPLDPSPLPLSFREQDGMLHYDGRYRNRPRRKGADVEVCFSGKIAVTEISVMEPSR
jgi:5'-nucleotidase